MFELVNDGEFNGIYYSVDKGVINYFATTQSYYFHDILIGCYKGELEISFRESIHSDNIRRYDELLSMGYMDNQEAVLVIRNNKGYLYRVSDKRITGTPIMELESLYVTDEFSSVPKNTDYTYFPDKGKYIFFL